MPMNVEELCRPLAWDTAHFGFPIAMLAGNRLTGDRAAQAIRWCQDQRIRCAYFLADPDDFETARLARQHGFVPVGTRVTLERCLTSGSDDDLVAPGGEIAAAEQPPLVDAHWTAVQQGAHDLPQSVADLGVGVRPAVPDDLAAIRRMAVQSYLDSRFYFDPGFDRERCDALYTSWTERCLHEDDAFLVAEEEGQPVGYISCKLTSPTNARIQLLAVVAGSQGRGIGRMLIEASLRWMIWREVDCVSVATHGRNLRSQRLYGRCGFLVQEIEQWYHRWFD